MAIEEVRCSAVGWDLPALTFAQEFSIEIPDKEADAILSSMFSRRIVGMAWLLLR